MDQAKIYSKHTTAMMMNFCPKLLLDYIDGACDHKLYTTSKIKISVDQTIRGTNKCNKCKYICYLNICSPFQPNIMFSFMKRYIGNQKCVLLLYCKQKGQNRNTINIISPIHCQFMVFIVLTELLYSRL